MIKNDNQLAIVREQFANAEAALDAIRHEVRPQNPKLYAVMAEPYIDMVLALRAEIDAYLGISAYQEFAGVIRSVDLDAQTFVLRERSDDEPDLACEYSAELEEAVKEYLDNRVRVSGLLEVSKKTHKSRMSVDSIELVVLEEPKALPST